MENQRTTFTLGLGVVSPISGEDSPRLCGGVGNPRQSKGIITQRRKARKEEQGKKSKEMSLAVNESVACGGGSGNLLPCGVGVEWGGKPKRCPADLGHGSLKGRATTRLHEW